MATIGTLLPSSTTSTSALAAAANSQSSASSSSSSSATSGTDALANQNTFLQLLVAQLQHQDPTQPMDGTTFVTQLAQFSNLTESVGTRQDLDAISKQYLGTVPSTTSTSSGTSTNSSAIGG